MIRSSTLIVYLLLSGFLISSCNKEEPSFVPNNEIIMAQLKTSPSIEYEESPLSHTDLKSALELEIYAINVFWKGKNITSYQPYASGLYNDISRVEIGLIVMHIIAISDINHCGTPSGVKIKVDEKEMEDDEQQDLP